jgi:15-cis-phytoene desaturase
MSKTDVIIIGSGLSGLSCAIHLVDEGKKVLVLESRDVIGGRTSSWDEKGMTVESGLHRFLGFFTHLPDLIEHVGAKLDDIIFWEDEIEIRLPDGQPSAVFGMAPLFKPLKTSFELLANNNFISSIQKANITKFFTFGFATVTMDPKKLEKVTVLEYAREQGVDDEAIYRVLIPLTEGLFFLDPSKYIAYNFFALFNPYLPKIYKSRAGAFKGGMTDVMMQPMANYIKDRGGTIQTNANVTELLIEECKVQGLKVGKKTINADNIIIATSLASAQEILKKHTRNTKDFSHILSLPSMPAVTFQIELKEPAMKQDRTTFSPGTIFSAYAEQSRSTFPKSPGRVSIILSKPHKYLSTTPEEILDVVLQDAKRLNLNLSEKNVTDYRKVTWKMDFLTYGQSNYKNRPTQKTNVKGLYLAGDFTDQEYLSTMEGAVYSGKLAAQALLFEK